jgi:pimeloyl-ACP methyl ester carboxylesterase
MKLIAILPPPSNGQYPVTARHHTAVTQFIDAGGTRYAYRQFGQAEGIPLLLLQHFTGTMDNWDPQVTDGLAEHFPVLLFDNKGIGATQGETPDNIEAMAQDALSFVKALGLTKVNLLGFSMGGFIAQQIALDAPELVHKLILAGTGPKGGEGLASSEAALSATAGMSAVDQKLYFFYKPTATSRALGLQSLDRINTRTIHRDPETPLQGIQSQLKAIIGWSRPDETVFERLSRIKQPVLVVNGSDDIICPTVNSILMFQHLPNARLSLYPDSAHGSIFQYPVAFLAEAVRFFKKNLIE